MVQTNKKYSLGEYHLEPGTYSLLRGSTPVPMSRKRFQVLLHLIEERHRLVTRQELVERFWQGQEVYEENLTKCISEIRKALNDRQKPYRTIETLPAVGYRYIGEVEELLITLEPSTFEVETTEAVKVVLEEEQSEIAPEVSSLERMLFPKGSPPLALPPGQKRRKRLIAHLVILLIVLTTTVGIVVVSRRPKPSIDTDPAISFLTDGSYDDIGPYWTNNGRIYFSRVVTNTRTETWTMNSDGSDQHRANTEIRDLLLGRWSPDGKKVIFSKEDNARLVFLADADGANEILLPFVPGNLDWSPDASQFAYQVKGPNEKFQLFLYTLKTGRSLPLSNGESNADPSFSYDGSQIAFTSWRDGNAEIYVMQSDGSNVRRLTNHPAFDQYPVFSPDGTQIAFQSNREDEHFEVYLQNLNDDSPPKRVTHSSTFTGLNPKCWSSDGTQMLLYIERDGNGEIFLTSINPFPSKLLLSDDAADLNFPRLSADGKTILYEARLADRSLELRLTNLESKQTRTIFKTEGGYPTSFHLAPAWSPDSSLIAFSLRSKGNSEIFTIKPDGNGLMNLTNNPLLDESPVFSADGKEIVFARDSYGRAELYRMDLNGANQRRVTNRQGYEMTPAFSPDGIHLAFAGDRDGHGLDVLVLDLQNPNEERIVAARRFQDSFATFSRDARRLAFVATGDGNPEIYVMNVDGSGLYRLTHSKSEEAAPAFSNDGPTLLFASNVNKRFGIYEVTLP